ncbi:MAG: argininosuccinate lyase [Candidatus Omnitrophota bacterium]
MAKKLWGARFTKEIDKDFFQFQKSIQYDYKLAKYDIYHSLIHVLALADAKILSKPETKKLISSLKEILKEIEANKFKPNLESEDIHTDIQNRIEKKIGRLALKLHTLRSRNDMIVFDEKFYSSDKASEIVDNLRKTIASLKYLSNQYKNIDIVGYTHSQRAQKIKFSDYIGAFIKMFGNDLERLSNFQNNLIIYIGSGAFKGTTLLKNYKTAIKKANGILRFKTGKIKVVDNPACNVSDRDFIVEFLSILANLQMHLSRICEDFILYSTKEFNYLELPEEFCTGSSLMPHKKNPDFLELVRGYTGRIYGGLISILVTMKGLPLTYNRDMQLDKKPLFSCVEIIEAELKLMAKFIKEIKLNKEVIKIALKDKSLYTVDLVESLVKDNGMPFKKAYDIVGKSIKNK